MSMQFNGFANVAGTDFYVTGAEVSITRSPIAPELVWGNGWKVNYATGQQLAEFSISFPLFADYVTTLKTIALVPGRDTAFNATISNGGIKVVYTFCKVQSLSFSADAMGNSPVTCTLRCVAKTGAPAAHAAGSASPTQTLGSTPIPSYALTFTASGGDVGSIPASTVTRFDLTIENNPFRLFTLNGQYTAADIQEGLQIVTGSFAYYSAGGGSTAAITNGALNISGGGLTLDIPSFLVKSDSNPIDSPSSKPMRIVGFEAFGDATNPPVS